MRRSAWPEYLDALETYLCRAAEAIEEGGSARRPPTLASHPVGPPPPQLVERAGALFAEVDQLASRIAARRDEVLAARQVLEGRRRMTRRGGGRIDWAL